MSFETINDLMADLSRFPGKDPAYIDKQLHDVPPAPVLVREVFLLSRCKGQVVLDIGASGEMHDAITKVAAKCYGIDRQDGPGVVGIDLDDYHAELPKYPGVTRVIAGEVLEHLSNPGWFLKRLKAAYGGVQTIITVPNATSESLRKWMERGVENVNDDHVAFYSWKTLRTLLGRFGYETREFYWYRGRERFSEGLIVVTE